MKRFLLTFALLLSFSCAGFAQVAPSPLWSYNWPAATATGVDGSYLILSNGQIGPPSFYSIDVYITGTAPSACTFEVQSSPDGVVWNSGAASVSGDQSCGTTANTDLLYSFYSKPVRFLRINIGTLTGGDGTTKVYFFYTRGRDGNNAQ